MIFTPYFKKNQIQTHDSITSPKTAVPYFTSTQLSKIYNYPTPNLGTKTVVGVISFGGSLVGKVSAAGVLTGGDVQAHWTYLGISPENFPQVVIVTLGGVKNTPTPSDAATIENTIDVETIGAMYPSANLTIVLYIAPNTLEGFTTLLHAVATPITVNGQVLKPSVVSCSWGAPEQYFTGGELNGVNSQLQILATAGITMTSAIGDNGSVEGSSGTNVNFPSSSPYNLACGGTHLICPNYVYDEQTVETVWSSCGGGISTYFAKPAYQTSISGVMGRATPDLSLVADPATGVVYTVGGIREVFGGTSIVAPAIAAFLAIVNYNQFITPLLGNYPESDFHDISSGSNGYCTGYGSINGVNLARSILATIVPVTGISLTTTTFTVYVGSTYKLTATVLPPNATNNTIYYSSSDTTIATVNASGIITGLSMGSVTITARTASGNFTIAANGTVPIVIPTSVSVAPVTANVNVGKTTTLYATIQPSTASNKSLEWLSSNTTIATVNASGVVTGISNGTVTITATTVSGEVKGSSIVTVLTPVSGISVLPTSVTVSIGGTATIVPTVQPVTASNKTVNWLSNNIAIVTVNSDGVIHGVKRGATSVLATAGAYGTAITVRVK